MAHKKAGGSKAGQGSKSSGKRLGVKIYSGAEISTGQVIVRQKGTKFHAGPGVGVGRDFTLFAKENGVLEMKKSKGKNVVEIKTVEKS